MGQGARRDAWQTRYMQASSGQRRVTKKPVGKKACFREAGVWEWAMPHHTNREDGLTQFAVDAKPGGQGPGANLG